MGVIEKMAGGLPDLKALFKKQKSEKVISKKDLDFAEDMLANLQPFIDYKRSEM